MTSIFNIAPRHCIARALSTALLFAAASVAHAEEGTFSMKMLTPETALKAAAAALADCRKAGYQVGVAVVDRMGVPQVLLRDRYAGAHTVEVAIRKAWTAASFRIPTTELALETRAGKPMSGLRGASQVLPLGGGLPIEGAGSTYGGIGVSGAPGGDADDACARAGLQAIADETEF